eukprot:TRINITY_DN47817_c0_g2_i2.p1 TRINITY_DN47817_c0_g2~~TRINITY_DN47817_c0_g2_i2.p1  ORF type:complete len:322 (-),score=51.42 TRINITY_DN47817_c0_g2_i2:407-1372(-)
MEKKSFSGRIRAFIKRKKYNEYLEGCSTKFELLFCILAYRNEQNNELRRKVANKVFLKTLEDTPEEDLIQIVPQGKTLLMVACEKNIGYDIVLALRTRLPNSEIFKVHKLYGHTSTALMLACGNDAPTEIIEMLMRDSPDDYLEVVNMGVTTAIRIACRYTTQVETMRLLLSRSNKHKLIENEEDTPNYALIIAMLMRAKRCPGLVECIWEATSLEYKKKIDSSGCSILFYGCKKGVHVDDLQLLLKDLPMSYRKLQDNDGRTPLHYLATSTCALEKLELVLNDVEEPFRSLQDVREITRISDILTNCKTKLGECKPFDGS